MRQFLTIREATKYIYPNINDATIHQWMSRGIFKPWLYKAPPTGPRNGCKLNIADLVTIGLFHQLLKCGAKFEDLRFNKSNPRLIQKMMEKEYCEYYVVASHAINKPIEIYFFKGLDFESVTDAAEQIKDRDYLGHAVINCNALFEHVTDKLRALSDN
jgi:hypothetical protein